MSILFHLFRWNVTSYSFNITLSLTGSFNNAKEHFGRLDIVVNNAAVCGETDWERTLDTNLVLSVVKVFQSKTNLYQSSPKRQPKISFVEITPDVSEFENCCTCKIARFEICVNHITIKSFYSITLNI